MILLTNQQSRKRLFRIEMVRRYVKSLKRKRYQQTYKRFTKVRAKHMDLEDEAAELHRREIADKHLMRRPYHSEAEAQEWVRSIKSISKTNFNCF